MFLMQDFASSCHKLHYFSASIYNACTVEDAQALVDYIKELKKTY